MQALIDKWQPLIDHINNPKKEMEDGRKVFNEQQMGAFLEAKLYDEENGETYMTLANLAALQAADSKKTPTLRLYAPVQTETRRFRGATPPRARQ